MLRGPVKEHGQAAIPTPRHVRQARRRAQGPGKGHSRAAIPALLVLLALLVVVPHPASPDGGTDFSEAWSLETPAPLEDSTVRLLGGDLFVRTRTALRIHDPATGAERWRYAPAGAAVRDWTSAGSTVIVKTLRPSPSGDVTALTGLSRATGAVLWHRHRLDLGGPLANRVWEESPPTGLAWDAASRALLGLTPGTGRTRWVFRLPPSCEGIRATGSGAWTAAIVTTCGQRIRVIALDVAGGTERWSVEAADLSALYVRDGVVGVSQAEGLLLHDAMTGRVIAAPRGCWNGCATVHAGGRIVVARDQEGTSAVEGLDPADGSVAWTRSRRNGPRYTRLVGVGGTVYATPSGDDLGRVLDVIHPLTGDLRRMLVPAAGLLFGADGDRLYFLQTTRALGRPARLRITALRVPDRLITAAPAPEPVAVPGGGLCDLLRTAGFTVLGEARHRGPAVPSFTTCEFAEAGGEAMTAEFWRLPTEAGAARVLAGLGADEEGEAVPGVGDEARVLGAHRRAVLVRAGRDLVRIRSPYLTVRERLVPVARELAGRLGSLRWAVPASWSPPMEHSAPPPGRTGRLPGTGLWILDSPGAALTLSAYVSGERGPTYLRDGDKFTMRREHLKAVSPDGRWAASDFERYVGGRDGVVLLDRRSGRIRRLPTVRRPWSNNTLVWSFDGRLLLTLWHEDRNENRTSAGVVVVDPARGTFTVTSTEKDEDTYEYPYRWSADASGVSTHFGIGSFHTDDGEGYVSHSLRTFGADGTVHSTLPGQGRPDSEILDPYSPSRRRLVGWCPERTRDLCVLDAFTGAPLARIEASSLYPIRWYDEEHLLVWRRHGAGRAASLMDLYGQVTADLARSDSAVRQGTKLFYVPR